MNVNTNRIIIESMIRKSIRDIRDSPRRNTRKLIDMAYQFAEGRFQHYFFEAAQKVLSDENSAFYDLVYDAATHVDDDRLVTFGMNLGYNGLTRGAITIRRIESELGYNVPWIITLAVDCSSFPERFTDYRRVISEGRSMGICSWILQAHGDPELVLPLTAEFPECAFFLQICPDDCEIHASDAVSTGFLSELSSGYLNVMPVLPLDLAMPDEDAALFGDMREAGLLYSVYHEYTPDDLDAILAGDYFLASEAIHAIFTVFIAAPTCEASVQDAVYKLVWQTLREQPVGTIPWEYTLDNEAIDAVVSNESCSVWFDASGRLVLPDGTVCPQYRLFEQNLSDILKQAFPKHTASL